MSLLVWMRSSLTSVINSINPLPDSVSPQQDIFPSDSSLQEQIKILINQQDSEIVIVDSKWFNDLVSFMQGGSKPGKVLSSSILTKSKKLRKGLEPGQNYFFVYFSIWNLLKCKDEEAIFPSIHKKLVKLVGLVEEHKKLLEFDIETDRADPTCIQLPGQVPRNECSVHVPEQVDDSDLKDVISTNYSSIGQVSSEGSMFGSVRMHRGKVGLENPGLFCYMNSGIQCLLSINYFVQSMLKLKQLGMLEDKQVCLLLADLIQTFFQVKNGWTIKTNPLRYFVVKYFPGTRQHDMPEFFRFVINSIESELGPDNLILTHVFNGTLCSTIICTECQNVSRKEEIFIDLQVELSESIEKSLESFTKDEVLGSGYHCMNCKRMTVAVKSLGVSNAPNCLCIQVKRFKQRPNPHKSTSFVKYRRKMTLKSLAGIKNYELVSVGVHIGSMNSGHYITYGKRTRGWYCFDDSLCTKVDLKRVLNQTAYMLVYKLIG